MEGRGRPAVIMDQPARQFRGQHTKRAVQPVGFHHQRRHTLRCPVFGGVASRNGRGLQDKAHVDFGLALHHPRVSGCGNTRPRFDAGHGHFLDQRVGIQGAAGIDRRGCRTAELGNRGTAADHRIDQFQLGLERERDLDEHDLDRGFGHDFCGQFQRRRVRRLDGKGHSQRDGQRHVHRNNFEIDLAKDVAGQRQADAPPPVIHTGLGHLAVERRQEPFDRAAQHQRGTGFQWPFLELFADATGYAEAKGPDQVEIITELIGGGGAAELAQIEARLDDNGQGARLKLGCDGMRAVPVERPADGKTPIAVGPDRDAEIGQRQHDRAKGDGAQIEVDVGGIDAHLVADLAVDDGKGEALDLAEEAAFVLVATFALIVGFRQSGALAGRCELFAATTCPGPATTATAFAGFVVFLLRLDLDLQPVKAGIDQHSCQLEALVFELKRERDPGVRIVKVEIGKNQPRHVLDRLVRHQVELVENIGDDIGIGRIGLDLE
mmetsp:Transcript_22457/g.36297  ORF Transcript_22457/g.36297 Transcript_22457/m.36297 type:complete len:492 (-) Transcript_22457:2124-3599(-)